MSLQSLTISGLRNIASLQLVLAPRTNIFSGPNGSGKTSILEAVHLLSLARSFRTSKYKHYIRHEEPHCTLFGRVAAPEGGVLPVGVQRDQGGTLKVRIAGETVESLATLAELLPVQLINADTFALLEGSPGVRRQFMDWGGFHLEPRFFSAWKATRRALKQRNSLLKYGKLEPSVRAAWDAQLVARAEELDGYRTRYIEALIPCFERLLAELVELEGLRLQYYRGWDRNRPLDQVLAEGLERDRAQGFTQQGPQRADLRVKVGGVAAAEILSRGQQKLVVSALKVAQGYLLKELMGRHCIYLIDDLPAELDAQHRQRLCMLLERMNTQVLVTCTDASAFAGCWSNDTDVQEFPIRDGKLANNPVNGSKE
ncbi:DNA replication/repair protein RecF [Motiliproteus sp. SC1-56]|uniref:DNA replication/repair protein RecF n=1 Tax=Motiliproteus sp. SC1-56 TaxID=2799565 RepID=UPI001A8CA666|nr:DNA replication/repair protein RecF [Motiliproteus sp. SC1-56]